VARIPGKVIEVVQTSPGGKWLVRVTYPFSVKASRLPRAQAEELAEDIRMQHARLGLESIIVI